MRIVRIAVMMVLFFGGVAATHAQAGGDEPGGQPETSSPAPAKPPRVIRISSAVLQRMLLKKVDPVYPDSARANGIEGQVILHLMVEKNCRIQMLSVVSGPEELRAAATEAVKQWIYKPYLLNGEPVEVDSTVIINFNLTSS